MFYVISGVRCLMELVLLYSDFLLLSLSMKRQHRHDDDRQTQQEAERTEL